MSGETTKQSLGQPTQKESRWLIGIVAVALALRLMMVVFRSADLHTDPDAYVALAKTVSETWGFHSPGTTSPTAYRPPLYPAVLALLMAAGFKSTTAICVVAMISGAVVTIAVWWLARVLGMRGVWSGIAASLGALDPLLLRYSPVPMTETLTAALITVAILQMFKVAAMPVGESPAGSAKPVKSAFLAGVMFALAGYCRPVCFLTCGVLTAVMLVRLLFSIEGAERRIGRPGFAVLPAVFAGILLIPWVVRNAVQLNAFIPLTSHGGYTLLLGNNEVFYREVVMASGQPVWTENSLATWQYDLNSAIEKEGITSESAKDRWMYSRAKRDILAEPNSFLRACFLRWKRFWGIQPRVGGQFAYRWVIWAVGIWYLMQWMGLAAALWQIRRSPETLLLWLAVLSFLLVHTFYWTNTRMRAPLTGVIVVLAVRGWEHLFYRFVRKKGPPPNNQVRN